MYVALPARRRCLGSAWFMCSPTASPGALGAGNLREGAAEPVVREDLRVGARVVRGERLVVRGAAVWARAGGAGDVVGACVVGDDDAELKCVAQSESDGGCNEKYSHTVTHT
jgi:hypothetical protein